MTDTAKHTPTPWSAGFNSQDFDLRIIGADGFSVAVTLDGNKCRDRETKAANAAFIVRAVNNHYRLVGNQHKLVRALEAALLYKADMDPVTRVLCESALASVKEGA